MTTLMALKVNATIIHCGIQNSNLVSLELAVKGTTSHYTQG